VHRAAATSSTRRARPAAARLLPAGQHLVGGRGSGRTPGAMIRKKQGCVRARVPESMPGDRRPRHPSRHAAAGIAGPAVCHMPSMSLMPRHLSSYASGRGEFLQRHDRLGCRWAPDHRHRSGHLARTQPVLRSRPGVDRIHSTDEVLAAWQQRGRRAEHVAYWELASRPVHGGDMAYCRRVTPH